MRSPSVPTPRSTGFRAPAAALVAMSGISGQTGSALATKLISQVGSAGALTLRLVFAAVTLGALLALGRPGARARARPREREWDPRGLLRPARRGDLIVVVVFGLALAGMNLSFYEAIARVPLGVAVTVEFVGPLAIAVMGSRRWTDGLWALLAAAGVLLLAGGSIFGVEHHLDLAGVGFAALAGLFWASYILLNKETGRRFRGTSGLAGAMAVAAVVITPIGVVDARGALFRPAVIGLGVVVALLSSAIPYTCELAALRRATPRAFGILLSIAPALGALAGLVILGQHLSWLEVGALVLVVVANIGSSWLGTRDVGIPSLGTPSLGEGDLDGAGGARSVRSRVFQLVSPAGSAAPPATPEPTARP
jgi:inner membrane transporter RhtA